MELSSLSSREETARPEAWLSTAEKLTEFFRSDPIEASTRCTKFVQRASKITSKRTVRSYLRVMEIAWETA